MYFRYSTREREISSRFPMHRGYVRALFKLVMNMFRKEILFDLVFCIVKQ